MICPILMKNLYHLWRHHDVITENVFKWCKCASIDVYNHKRTHNFDINHKNLCVRTCEISFHGCWTKEGGQEIPPSPWKICFCTCFLFHANKKSNSLISLISWFGFIRRITNMGGYFQVGGVSIRGNSPGGNSPRESSLGESCGGECTRGLYQVESPGGFGVGRRDSAGGIFFGGGGFLDS